MDIPLSKYLRFSAPVASAVVQALGMKPKTVRDKIQPNLDQREMKQVMEGGQEEAEEEGNRGQAEIIQGVGYTRLGSMLPPQSRRRDKTNSQGTQAVLDIKELEVRGCREARALICTV